MAALTLRGTKGSPLTNAEVDTNFTNINTEVGTKLDSSAYTATDVLNKIKTVDGVGSGLDADLLDGLASATANTVSTIVARDASGNFSAGTITATLSGNATSATTATTATTATSATSAATLTTARLIGGVSFNGSANINLPGVNAAGNQNTSGNAATATSAATLTTARTIGGVSFDGSANINLPGVNAAGNQNTSGTAAGLSTTLVVGSGGTGATTLTANSVIIGNGTSAVTFIAPGTAGNVLTSNGTTWTSGSAASGASVATLLKFQ